MTSMIFEMNFNDFRKRDFAKDFDSRLYELFFENDDALFEDYVRGKKWQAFKLNLAESVLCQQNYNKLLKENRPAIVSNQTSRERPRKNLQSLETIRGKMSQCNSLVKRYIKEKETNTPMILNVKNRIAVTMIATKSKATRRLHLETCLRL